MKKQITALTIIFIMLITTALTSCNTQEDTRDILYQSDSTTVHVVESLKNPKSAGSTSWMRADYAPIFEICANAVSGIVSNATEIQTDYEFMGQQLTHFSTIFDLQITEVFHSKDDLQVGDTIKMITGQSSREFNAMIPPIINDMEYIIFTAYPELERTKAVADYIVDFPYLLFVMIDENFDENDIWGIVQLLSEPINSPSGNGFSYDLGPPTQEEMMSVYGDIMPFSDDYEMDNGHPILKKRNEEYNAKISEIIHAENFSFGDFLRAKAQEYEEYKIQEDE